MSAFDLVDDYFCSVCEVPTKKLHPASHALVEVFHSFGLIQNGGMHGYLCSVGDQAQTTAHHYRTANLRRCSDLLGLAYDLWRDYWPHPSPEESDPDAFRDRFGSELDAIEEEFYGLEDEMIDKLAEIVRSQAKTG